MLKLIGVHAKRILQSTKREGFTIVELLIVIVVIAILATIGVVAYNGIQKRAVNAQVLVSVRNYEVMLKNTLAYSKMYPNLTSDSTLVWNGDTVDGVPACLGTGMNDTDHDATGYCYNIYVSHQNFWRNGGNSQANGVSTSTLGTSYSNFIRKATGDSPPTVSAHKPVEISSGSVKKHSTGIMYGFNLPPVPNSYESAYNPNAKSGVFLYYVLYGRTCAANDTEVSLDTLTPGGAGPYTKGDENLANRGQWPDNDAIRCARKVADKLPTLIRNYL